MSGPIRDLLALIGLACVVSTPIVLALLAMAGRREEEDHEDEMRVGLLAIDMIAGIRELNEKLERGEPVEFSTPDGTRGILNPPADPVRDLAARAKGGDE